MKTKGLVDITGMKYDRFGEKQFEVTMKDCRFGGSKFNLCSTTKMMKEGWIMLGNEEGILMTKGESKIHFDIPIRSKEGIIWAMYVKRK